MRQAIVYLTYNGIFNNTNGIGTQAKTFISGMLAHRQHFTETFGDFDVHLMTQIPYLGDWGYSENDRAYAEESARSLGGKVHYCPYAPSKHEFWVPESWRAVSVSAAAIICELASDYDRILVIANDIPFLHVPLYVERAKEGLAVSDCEIKSLIALYGSSYVHMKGDMDPERLAWEGAGLAAPKLHEDVKLGIFGQFMHRHFVEKYGADPDKTAPYASSLVLEHSDFRQLGADEVEKTLVDHGIPLDRPLVFGFGRADRVKGFDLLLDGMADVRDMAHMVLNVVPYEPGAPIMDDYRAQIERNGLSATLLEGYSRTLPMALSQWRNTRAVVCPSRGEPLSNVPFEVALWAKDRGPVLVCAALEGYLEQIDDGTTGYLFDPSNPSSLGSVLSRILHLGEDERATMRKAAYEKVVNERDMKQNFSATLASFWK